MYRYLISTFWIFIYFSNIKGQHVYVNTSRGQVFGYHFDQGNDTSRLFYGQADIFLGIPYVQTPQRYQRAQPISKFPQNPYNATTYGSVCPQISVNRHTREDCLSLNIYSPNVSSNTKYPVLVYIHGGGFIDGNSESWFPIPGIVRNLVSRGVVVAAINYRLGFLGFFTTKTDAFPPNLGLLDQVEALKFIQQEISNFGGDPTHVTIFGESAGAVSVSAHTYSPLSQGLFHQGIQESGTVLMGFEGALGRNHPSFRFAQAACNYTIEKWNSGSYGDLKDCLSKISVEVGLNIENKVFGEHQVFSVGATVCWDFVQDNYFFPDVPRNLYKTRKEKPMIIGTCHDEFASWGIGSLYNNNYTRNFSESHLASKFATFWKNETQNGIELYENMYLDEAIADDDHKGWYKFVDNVGTSLLFTGHAAQDIEQHLWNNNSNVYVYEFTYSPINGLVGHTAEKGYLFMMHMNENTTSKTEIAIADFLGEAWTNFTKYGKPTSNDYNGNHWSPTTSDGLTTMEYFHINNVTTNEMRTGYRELDRVARNRIMPVFVGTMPEESPDYNNGSHIGCPDRWIPSTINNKRCFSVFSYPLSQSFAQATCVNHLGSLISIDSAFENTDLTKNIKSLAPQCSIAYIGLVENNNSWTWNNNDTSSYRNWEAGNPSNDPKATCAVLSLSDGKWSNQECDSRQCFICSFEF